MNNTVDADKTPWVLGYAAPESNQSRSWKRILDWRDTYLGGLPTLPAETVNINIPKCRLCGQLTVLVLQAFAPTSHHSERLLLVFGCNSVRCSGDSRAWFCLRLCRRHRELIQGHNVPTIPSLQSTPATQEVLNSCILETSAFLNLSDPDNGSEDMEQIDSLLKLRSLKLSGNSEVSIYKKPQEQHGERLKSSESRCRQLKSSEQRGDQSNSSESRCDHELDTVFGNSSAAVSNVGSDQQPLCLQYVPIEVDLEPTSQECSDSLADDVQRLLATYLKSNSETDEDVIWEQEHDEIETEKKVTEDRFRDHVALSPTQLLRYKFNGEPLWPSYPTPESSVTCQCGNRRVFEIQLLPTCLSYLDVNSAVPEDETDAGMNWATVVVYSCIRDCEGSSSVGAEWITCWEHVIVQPDEF